jgi:hypothetical protein
MTPESALGRLINLGDSLTFVREQLMNADYDWAPDVGFNEENYCRMVDALNAAKDDLDDLIRSIERGMNSEYTCPNCEAPMELPDSEDYTVVPDSEDMERRPKK